MISSNVPVFTTSHRLNPRQAAAMRLVGAVVSACFHFSASGPRPVRPEAWI
ncbi:hypothetical protein [Paenibacillus lautus]|uniref:hypothetical protein n=1 Tax=Paenibacillus lautus TaxID=1401 RepID=UPI003D9A7E62